MKIEFYVKLGKSHILITRIKLAAKNDMDPLQIPAPIPNLAVPFSLKTFNSQIGNINEYLMVLTEMLLFYGLHCHKEI